MFSMNIYVNSVMFVLLLTSAQLSHVCLAYDLSVLRTFGAELPIRMQIGYSGLHNSDTNVETVITQSFTTEDVLYW